MHPDDLTRRWFLACLTASGGAGFLTASHSSMPLAQGTQLAVTPHCLDDEPTPAQTEGPYFTPHSPEKRDLRKPGDKGIPFILRGAVVNRSCRHIRSVFVEPMDRRITRFVR